MNETKRQILAIIDRHMDITKKVNKQIESVYPENEHNKSIKRITLQTLDFLKRDIEREVKDDD